MTTPVAGFNYLAPIHRLVPPELPFRYAYPPPKGRPEHNEVLDRHEFKLNDIRDHINDIGLDKSGFGVLLDAKLEFGDWDNDAKIRSEYYEETISLLKGRLGASRVVIFDHTLRRRNKDTDHLPDKLGKRQPVFRVHIDQTPEAGRVRVLNHLGADGPSLLKKRSQIINVWRPLRGPVVDAPLGLCDIRSVDKEKDLVVGKLLYRDREGSTFLVHHNPNHEWYYLSDMQSDEVILIKCYDNKLEDKVAPHSGFTLDVPEGKSYLPRHSIEVRCLVFYEDEDV